MRQRSPLENVLRQQGRPAAELPHGSYAWTASSQQHGGQGWHRKTEYWMMFMGDPHTALLFAADLIEQLERFLGRECPRTRAGAQYDSSAGGERPICESDEEQLHSEFDAAAAGSQYHQQRAPRSPTRGPVATGSAQTSPAPAVPVPAGPASASACKPQRKPCWRTAGSGTQQARP